MRALTGMSGILVAFAMIVMIHCAIVSTHIRNSQVNNGLDSACDYAVDKMYDLCADIDFENSDKNEAVNVIISSFCAALESVISTDGTIKVYVTKADIDNGAFDFNIEETYDYGVMGRTGTARCERAVRFK